MAGLAHQSWFCWHGWIVLLGHRESRGLSSLKSTPWTSTQAAKNGYQPYISRRFSRRRKIKSSLGSSPIFFRIKTLSQIEKLIKNGYVMIMISSHEL